MQVVWFKRDLRIHDHAALALAAQAGPVLPLYILEPELWSQPDMSARQYAFLLDCLRDLNDALSGLGHRLIIRVGSATEILEDLHRNHRIHALWSHQETWNAWTYTRDRAVSNWCRTHAITWHEPLQHGVFRRLSQRDHWAKRWHEQMLAPRVQAPYLPPADPMIVTDHLPSGEKLGLFAVGETDLQSGGRRAGVAVLNSFLYERGRSYTRQMSSPVTAFDSCSRLSPHLAFGTISLREAFQATEKRAKDLRDAPQTERGTWPRAIKSFSSRLRWHCHFIQKLEDQPSIEYQNLHPAYDGLRPREIDEKRLHAWATGTTGYPMIDASMRALRATGWLNFRMRAMVMSFSSYHLWQDWRRPAQHLAQMFVDYEPGIHFSQVQMQSGTTGINSIRIYNPIKQSIDQDPKGVFIRKWIPELRDMDTALIHTPWKAASQMNGYPMPIVDEPTARRAAADLVYGLRKNNPLHRTEARRIVEKHASRKKPPAARKKRTTSPNQPELPF